MNLLLWLTGIVLCAVLLAAGLFRFVGPEKIWAMFGPADLGPVVFEKLERRATPNDALVCPTNLCPADSDIFAPVFPVNAATLQKAMSRALMSERRLTLVAIDDEQASERYIQRSERMHFPDTIVVRYLDAGGGRSTIAMYSRSQLGSKDFGANAERIERWLKKLSVEVKKLAPVA
jgi:uncharacterized protein (DUF1499 family)